MGKKNWRLQAAASYTLNSFEIGRNHLLPYPLLFSEDRGKGTYTTEGVGCLCTGSKWIHQAVEWLITPLLLSSLNNFC